MKTTFIVVMLVMALASCAIMPLGPDTGVPVPINHTRVNPIPDAAMAKYQQLELEYKNSLGAGINQCVSRPFIGTEVDAKGKETPMVQLEPHVIYQVGGSGGYTGVGFYYGANGTSLGTDTWTDAITGDEPIPTVKVNISEYTCTKVISSNE